jgi:hypothetical protein
VNPLLTSPVREIRTLGSVGAGGGQLPPATRWAVSDVRPYRDRNWHFPESGFAVIDRSQAQLTFEP